MYKIYDLEKKRYFEDYSPLDIAHVIFMNYEFEYFEPSLNEKIKQIIAWLSFHKNDVHIKKWESNFSIEKGLVRTVKLIPKKFRIYDEYDRIVPPHEIKQILKNYKEDEYNKLRKKYIQQSIIQNETKEQNMNKIWKFFRKSKKEALSLRGKL
jgi:hypothetical protein